MRRVLLVGMLIAGACWADGGPCLIVKHKGTIGRRLVFTALTAIPMAPGSKFDYVDSLNLPQVKLSYTTGQVNRMLNAGLRVVILPTNYKLEELKDAREQCRTAEAPKPDENDPYTHFSAGDAFLEQRRFTDALIEYRWALDLAPQNPIIEERIRRAEEALDATASAPRSH